MRAYIDGALHPDQETFIIEDLWFATNDCDDNTIVSETCMCLSGLHCESNITNKYFYCRWKGVLLTYINDDGVEIETEDFTVKEFLKMLEDKDMKLVNANAYFDKDVNAKILKLLLVDNDYEESIDVSEVDEIEFIS